MRLTAASLLSVALLSAAAPPLAAQWLKHPTPGVPKTAAGTPRLDAPAPKSADGKPDLSGIWIPLDNRPCPAEGCADMRVGQQFVDMGWGIPGGLPYQPWAAALTKQRTAELRLNDPNSQCLPIGIVRMHTTPLYRKIVQTPGLVIILSERQVWYRQIFTDGRPLPPDPVPTWNGYSVGKWEGDTLVVQSGGFRDGMWLDANGSPLTDAAQNHRALPPHELRHARHHDHRRRSEGVHGAMDDHDPAPHRPRHRAHRLRVPGEREGHQAPDRKVEKWKS